MSISSPLGQSRDFDLSCVGFSLSLQLDVGVADVVLGVAYGVMVFGIADGVIIFTVADGVIAFGVATGVIVYLPASSS